MKSRDQLVESRRAAWTELEGLLRAAHDADHRRGGRVRLVGVLSPVDVLRLSELYRELATDLMVVRRESFDAALEEELDQLAAHAHNVLYAGLDARHPGLVAGLLDWPGAVRRNALGVGVASLLFFVPVLASGLVAFFSEPYALALLGVEQVESFEQMYRNGPGERGASIDAQMTGFYIWNNVGIAFRCFATGIFFGLGPVLYLVYNGLTIGAVGGRLVSIGLGESFFSFVSSHAPMELTAIALAGGAGIQMGLALVMPRGLTRLGRLRAVGPELYRQVLGVAVLLVVAAVVEGNVSPSVLSAEVKYGIGAVGWVIVGLLIFFAGRGRARPLDVVEAES